jgi:hypothetical protein
MSAFDPLQTSVYGCEKRFAEALVRLVLYYILAVAVGACSAVGKSAPPVQSDEWPPPHMNEYPVQLCGINAFGAQADLDRVKMLARRNGFPILQMDVPELQLSVIFPYGTDPSLAAAFTRRLKSAEFSSVSIKTGCSPPPP